MSEKPAASDTELDLPPRIVWEHDGKEMILVARTTFRIGRDDSRPNESPSHLVTIKPFYIDRYPVTHAEYHRFVQFTNQAIPCYHVEWIDTEEYNWDPETGTPPSDKVDHPVVQVSWEDARAYSEWAQKRLPTEAEWECAARGVDERRWPWGNEFGRGRCNTLESNIGRTTAVYRFSPQGDGYEGVGDLIGNVWEWTSSLYWPYPYDADDGREGLQARGWRVLRGGSWLNDLTIASATARLDGDFIFFTNIGFRCAVSADVVNKVLQNCSQP